MGVAFAFYKVILRKSNHDEGINFEPAVLLSEVEIFDSKVYSLDKYISVIRVPSSRIIWVMPLKPLMRQRRGKRRTP